MGPARSRAVRSSPRRSCRTPPAGSAGSARGARTPGSPSTRRRPPAPLGTTRRVRPPPLARHRSGPQPPRPHGPSGSCAGPDRPGIGGPLGSKRRHRRPAPATARRNGRTIESLIDHVRDGASCHPRDGRLRPDEVWDSMGGGRVVCGFGQEPAFHSSARSAVRLANAGGRAVPAAGRCGSCDQEHPGSHGRTSLRLRQGDGRPAGLHRASSALAVRRRAGSAAALISRCAVACAVSGGTTSRSWRPTP